MERDRPTIGVPEAAKRLGLSEAAVRSRLLRRAIPGGHRMGGRGRWRIDEATFEAARRLGGYVDAKEPSEFPGFDPLPFGQAAEKGEGDAA